MRAVGLAECADLHDAGDDVLGVLEQFPKM